MNILDNYQKIKKKIFFSENKDIQNHRERLINIFENDIFDKKNNESLKNINLKNFLEFKYNYLVPEETSVINNNHDDFGKYMFPIIEDTEIRVSGQQSLLQDHFPSGQDFNYDWIADF